MSHFCTAEKTELIILSPESFRPFWKGMKCFERALERALILLDLSRDAADGSIGK